MNIKIKCPLCEWPIIAEVDTKNKLITVERVCPKCGEFIRSVQDKVGYEVYWNIRNWKVKRKKNS